MSSVRSKCLIYLVTCVVITVSSFARADGLIYTLPTDGTWVRYVLSEKGTVTTHFPDPLKVALPYESQSHGTLTLSSVGRAKVDGEMHRWIELSIDTVITHKLPPPELLEGNFRSRKRKIVYKMLIAEKRFEPGEDPLAHLRRLYYRYDDNPDEHVTDEQDIAYRLDRFGSLYSKPSTDVSILHDQILTTAEELPKQLKCDVLLFESNYEDRARVARGTRGIWQWRGKQEIWRNDQTPFGVAYLKAAVRLQLRGRNS